MIVTKTQQYLESVLKTGSTFYNQLAVQYPGDDFYTVSKEEFEKCIAIMYHTVKKLKNLEL